MSKLNKISQKIDTKIYAIVDSPNLYWIPILIGIAFFGLAIYINSLP